VASFASPHSHHFMLPGPRPEVTGLINHELELPKL
jgi:hypothetical protein